MSLLLKCAGTPAWQQWVLPEEEGIKHIKAAYVSLRFNSLIYDLNLRADTTLGSIRLILRT
jgi:hypothetical protein